jgi:hypothetical protein
VTAKFTIGEQASPIGVFIASESRLCPPDTIRLGVLPTTRKTRIRDMLPRKSDGGLPIWYLTLFVAERRKSTIWKLCQGATMVRGTDVVQPPSQILHEGRFTGAYEHSASSWVAILSLNDGRAWRCRLFCCISNTWSHSNYFL